jgi:hypothetical protein
MLDRTTSLSQVAYTEIVRVLASFALICVVAAPGTLAQVPEPAVPGLALVAQLDAAFREGDAAAVARLAANEEYRDTLMLPRGPLVRVKILSPRELIYQDPSKNQWRISWNFDPSANAWVLARFSSLCPAGPAVAAPPDTRPAKLRPWTVMQCWPARR